MSEKLIVTEEQSTNSFHLNVYGTGEHATLIPALLEEWMRLTSKEYDLKFTGHSYNIYRTKQG